MNSFYDNSADRLKRGNEYIGHTQKPVIRAIIFDFFGVIESGGKTNKTLLNFIKSELKPKYKIGILSNVARDIKNWLGDSQNLFDEILLSHEHGLAKPDARFYKLMADKLRLNTGECIYIDDGIANCEGARMAGMQTIQYKDFVQLKIDLSKLLAE